MTYRSIHTIFEPSGQPIPSEEEVLLGAYGGGLHGITSYDAYDMTDSGLAFKSMVFDEHSRVDLDNKIAEYSTYGF